jgi:hypothetical protein
MTIGASSASFSPGEAVTFQTLPVISVLTVLRAISCRPVV